MSERYFENAAQQELAGITREVAESTDMRDLVPLLESADELPATPLKVESAAASDEKQDPWHKVNYSKSWKEEHWLTFSFKLPFRVLWHIGHGYINAIDAMNQGKLIGMLVVLGAVALGTLPIAAGLLIAGAPITGAHALMAIIHSSTFLTTVMYIGGLVGGAEGGHLASLMMED